MRTATIGLDETCLTASRMDELNSPNNLVPGSSPRREARDRSRSGFGTTNHRGRVYRAYDGAGVATTLAFDFRGQAVQDWRQLTAADNTNQPDWSALLPHATIPTMSAAAAPLLSTETFSASNQRDALGRVLTAVSPDGSLISYTYDPGGGLQTVELDHKAAGTTETVVGNITYDAKGQRTSVVYGPANAPTTTTTYTHDPLTYRLTRLRTLRHTYDAHGSMTTMPHLAAMDWAHADQLEHVTAGTQDPGGVADGFVERYQSEGALGFTPWPKLRDGVRGIAQADSAFGAGRSWGHTAVATAETGGMVLGAGATAFRLGRSLRAKFAPRPPKRTDAGVGSESLDDFGRTGPENSPPGEFSSGAARDISRITKSLHETGSLPSLTIQEKVGNAE